MSEKLKEVRIYFCVAILIAMFLPWAALNLNMDVDFLDIEDNVQTSYTGLTMCQEELFGVAIYLIPLALLVIELVEQIHLDKKLFYLLGSILGIVLSVIGFLTLKGLMDASYMDEYSSASTTMSPKIGFWITIAAYLAIIVYTLVRDYALSRETIQEKGIKNAFTDIAGSVASDLSEQAGKVQTQGISGLAEARPAVTCPNCGAAVAAGKRFCAKCGSKIEAADQPQEKRAAAAGAELTVRQYLAKLKNVSCVKCGARVAAGNKFCPECGAQVVVMVAPKTCACGAKLPEGKKFCPDCGAEIQKVRLRENCAKCGAELIYGKKFCVECGECVED